MSNSADASYNLGLFGEILCPDTTLRLFAPHVHPYEVRFLTEECSSLFLRCHTCKTLNSELIQEIGGLVLETPPLLTPRPIDTKYLPIVTEDFIRSEIDSLPFVEYVGVSLRALIFILKRYGHHRPKCLEGKKLIVFLTGNDNILEKYVWVHQRSLIKHLAQMGVTAVVSPNFSVFYRWCPIGQQYNLKRSLYYSQELSAAGIPVIPHFYSQNRFHTERIVEYLNHHPEINIYALNCQMQKKLFDREVLYEELNSISSTSGTKQVVLEGATMTDLKKHRDSKFEIILANKLPFSYAQYGRSIEVTDTCQIYKDSGLSAGSPEELEELTMSNLKNVQKFAGICF